MIIQCDQCNTKFKLDDAKVPDKGVKVRCAKCKSIFLVQKEAPAEEPDFDSLLSGLGNEAPGGDAGMPEQEAAARSEGVEAEGEGTEEMQEPPEKAPDESTSEAMDQHSGRDDFGEDFFAAGEESTPPGEEASESGEYQFGELPSGPGEGEEAAEEAGGDKDDFTFGEISLGGDADLAGGAETEAPAVPQSEPDEFDFGSFDTGPEEAAPSTVEEEAGAEAGDVDAEGFDFAEEEAPPVEDQGVQWQQEPEAEGTDDFLFSAAAEPLAVEKEEDATPVSGEGMDAAELDAAIFGESAAATSAAPPESELVGEAAPEPPADTTARDKAVVTEPVIPFGSSIPSLEEELPPLAISTRKKGSSIFSGTVTAIAVLVVLAVAGLGFYLYKEGPAAFDKLGLSFLAKWVGMESTDSGNIAVKGPQGAFMVNKEAGEIFVVSGEAVNNYRVARASIQVKATVLGPNGKALMEKTAYCGNPLTKEQLTTLPMEKIEAAMDSPFGDSLSNLEVPPGKGIPFVIVFSKVPKDAGEFSVEVVGSTVAGQ